MTQQAIIIFARNLIYGKVKTRLAATLGDDQAFAVYKKLLAHTANVTTDLPVNKHVFYSDSIDHNDVWTEQQFSKHVQQGNDLGERMYEAFAKGFHLGYKKLVIIGTDCVELTPAILKQAFEQLGQHDVVVGPAKDGGYYLLGLKRLEPRLFQNIEWSTDTVLQRTISICQQLQLNYYCLQELNDIDEEKDLVSSNLLMP